MISQAESVVAGSKQVELAFLQLFHPDNLDVYEDQLEKSFITIKELLQERKKPFSGVRPEELNKLFSLLNPGVAVENGDFDKVLLEVKKLYLDHAVLFHDTKYVAHLNCPIVTPAIAAELILSSINSSLDTYDQSAGGTFIETKLIQWTTDLIGYDENADGVFTSGGTQSNLMGLLLARDHYCATHMNWNVKQHGLPFNSKKYRIFCSDVSHFSIQKNASLLGLGQQAVVKVASDSKYKMQPKALEGAILQELNNGNIPIAIVGTAGTTDFGSLDPLHKIAKIAKEYDTWFHVDAAVGGGLLLSDKYIHRLEGIQFADSVTIDYHKTFFQPVSCSAFLMKDKSMSQYICYHADYLNSQEQEKDGLPNQVNKSLQTTKRFDALKLWMTLRTMGREKLGQYYEQALLIAQHAAELIGKLPDFELLNWPELNCLVFRYRPQDYQGSYCLNDLNLAIKKALFTSGEALIASTKVQDEVYLKFTLLNPLTTQQDIQTIVNLIEQYGKSIISQRL